MNTTATEILREAKQRNLTVTLDGDFGEDIEAIVAEELFGLVPVHPATGVAGGPDREGGSGQGNILPFNDLMIAVAALEQGDAVLTGNLRHFQRSRV